MNIITFLMLSFSVVSCVRIEDVSDDPLTLFDPLESGGDLSHYDDPSDFDFSKELSPLDEDVETDLDEIDYEETPSDEYYDTEIKDATRLSCPFSGKNCRFKKAKCRCSSKDGDFKFTMKKFGMTDDDKTEELESPEEPLELPQEHTDANELPQEHTDTNELPKQIVQQVPEMVEGFKMLEDLNDPSQLVLDKAQEGTVSEQPSNDSGLQMAPTTGGQDEFEDKTIRVRTEDKKDKDKKVHEYEYLRVKKVDNKNGVNETHLESPKSQNPSFMYHKGAIPKMDLSVKSRISSVFPPKVDEQAPAPEAIEYSQPLAIEYPQPLTTDHSKQSPIEYSQPLAIEYPQPLTTDHSKQSPIEYSQPLAIDYPQQLAIDHSKQPAIDYPQQLAIDYPQPLTTGEDAPRKLSEVKQHKQESSQPQSEAVKPFNKDLRVQKYKPVVTQGLKKPVEPPTPKFVSLSYPGGVTDLTAGRFQEGAKLRSLKKNKSKKAKNKGPKAKKAKKSKKSKKTKEQKSVEKQKKKEMKKKRKLSNEQEEKNQNAVLEKMKEKDRFLGERLEKEKEELEKKQESGAVIAKRVRQLQIEKDRQEKKIKLAEKRIQAKKDRERKAEKDETLKQLKKEKALLREQEKQLDDIKVDSVDREHEAEGEGQLLEKNSTDETDDSTNL